MDIHESITEDRVISAVAADEGVGFCLACGEEDYGFEPDAYMCFCVDCGLFEVCGAEEVLVLLEKQR